MTIDEAIETLKRDRFDNPDYYLLDFQSAIDLGIEALKRIDHCRRWASSTWGSPLPGETE